MSRDAEGEGTSPLWVALVGAPSTGKTTLAGALAVHYGTVWMPEYGREYWIEHQVDRRLSPEQLVEIAEGHREREDILVSRARRFFFVDTEAIVTYLFALDYHDGAHPRLAELADASARRYDVFVLCQDDIPYDDTWERSGSVHRARFQRQIVDELERRGIAYLTVAGSVEERLALVVARLDTLDQSRPSSERSGASSRS